MGAASHSTGAGGARIARKPAALPATAVALPATPANRFAPSRSGAVPQLAAAAAAAAAAVGGAVGRALLDLQVLAQQMPRAGGRRLAVDHVLVGTVVSRE